MSNTNLSTGDVVRISGASPRQLDYWIMLGLLRPSGRSSTPKNRWREYTFSDLMVTIAIKSLREQGVSLQHIRAVVDQVHKRIDRATRPAEVLKKLKCTAYGGKVYVNSTTLPVHRAIDGQTTFLFVDFEDIHAKVQSRL